MSTKNMPKIIYKMRTILNNTSRSYYNKTDVISTLYKSNINIRETNNNWCSSKIYDKSFGWLPVNILFSSMKNPESVGNIAICVQSYTNEILKLENNYKPHYLSTVLHNRLKNKNYNYHHGKDHYFLVFNKEEPSDIIINSVRGLSVINHNINCMPFQVCWDENLEYKYKPIEESIEMFKKCMKKTNLTWEERFIYDIKKI